MRFRQFFGTAALLFAFGTCVLPAGARAAADAPADAIAFRAGVRPLDVRPAEPRNWRGALVPVLHCTLWYPADASARETVQEFSLPGLPPLFYAGTAATGAPLASAAGKLPLIVLSHGLGGTADQFGWLAPALARRGYLVLGVNHPGNNTLEPFTAEGALLWGERATDLSDAIDGLLADRTFGSHVDAARIGAAGYSLGGETVLALAGARIDQRAFFDFCLQHPNEPTCGIPAVANMQNAQDLLAAVLASNDKALAKAGESFRDARVRAVFAIAPAAGQAFHRSSFDYVNVPVTMVAGTADSLAPPALNAEQFAQWLPSAKVAVLKDVGHYTFLDTCTPDGTAVAPQFCTDAPTVSRDAIHTRTAAMAISFFDRTLAPVSAGAPAAAHAESSDAARHGNGFASR